MEVELITLTPMQALGIPIALVGAVFLALGAEFQHRGVNKVDAATGKSASTGLSVGQLLALVKRPSWVLGTLMLGLAIVFQLVSLFLAPLTVVQPLGAIALVITSIVTARTTKTKLSRQTIRGIIFCVGGIALFVTVAALTTSSLPIDETQLIIVLVILAIVLVILGAAFLMFRHRFTNIFYIVGAGILFGFVATLAKVIIDRVHTIVQRGFHLTPSDGITIFCIVGIIAAALIGSYFVQTAYSSGPPDLVVAGLTVIDPIVGVSIGIFVLGEAATAPIWAGFVFVIAGALAAYGVFQLARRAPHVAELSDTHQA
ncbi:DMT family transporter [Subtercola frigoramans]|uniref:Drug/metabolite transporter (DMT)-like permease n=1 Tax=Subtercola frigoramans TaxID=120298 RepID=A0ABS2L5S1_9MICO|nr:DMT family transporter [Subtercola frigoramans]MBM7472450.1 drug/metabolite transporter (DMT)-like permease [Subtercola frigoramans]